jgi:hypothetical protein
MLISVAENDFKAEQIIKHSQSDSLVSSSAQEYQRKFLEITGKNRQII